MKPKSALLQTSLLITAMFFLIRSVAFSQIVGMGLTKTGNETYVWYANGTVWKGASSRPVDYQAPSRFHFLLPSGKSAADIVGMGFSSIGKVFAWYSDGTVSAGSDQNLTTYREPKPYSLPPGKSPSDIVGIGISSGDKVFAWYADGTVSAGSSRDLKSYRETYRYSLPPGKSPADIVEMDIASNDRILSWYADGSLSWGTSNDLDYYSQNVNAGVTPTVYDPAGNQYNTLQLAGLTWTQQNMNYNTGNGSWCYGNNAANCSLYGRLYTWSAARSACQALGAGWRLPTDAEWTRLVNSWSDIHAAYRGLIRNGENDFNGLLSGLRTAAGEYMGAGYAGHYWSGTEYSVNGAWFYTLHGNTGTVMRSEIGRSQGHSCRCVHD